MTKRIGGGYSPTDDNRPQGEPPKTGSGVPKHSEVSFCWIGIHKYGEWVHLSQDDKSYQYKECQLCKKRKYIGGPKKHEWGMWEDRDVISIMPPEGGDIPIRRELVQTRICKSCGKKESHRIIV